jgi:hypothetical protein
MIFCDSDGFYSNVNFRRASIRPKYTKNLEKTKKISTNACTYVTATFKNTCIHKLKSLVWEPFTRAISCAIYFVICRQIAGNFVCDFVSSKYHFSKKIILIADAIWCAIPCPYCS